MLFTAFLAEVFLVTALLFQLLFNSNIISNPYYNFLIIIKEVSAQTIFILFILFILLINAKLECYSGFDMFHLDLTSTGVKIFAVCLSIAIIYIITPVLIFLKLNFHEIFSLILFSIFSLLLLLSAHNLLSFYLAIEMQTICFYIISSYNRKSAFSTESGLKYFLSGSYISGCFLLGTALIFSFLGTLSLPEITSLLVFIIEGWQINFLVIVGIILITGTLLFKLACAPFHLWAPDVYEGAPLSSTIIFSILPKLGIVYFFIKWLFCLGVFFTVVQPMLIFLGIFSCLLGTLFSLNQKRLKRVIVYSSIAQVGFIVSGLALNSVGACSAVLMFLIIYLITSLLIWGHFTSFYYFHFKIATILQLNNITLHLTSLSGLANKNNVWATSLLLIFFSIAGIPPLTGFLTKVLILLELNLAGKFFIAVFLIIISSLSAYYYIRIIKTIFFETNQHSTKESSFQVVFLDNNLKKLYFLFSILLFLLIILFFFPSTLYLFCINTSIKLLS